MGTRTVSLPDTYSLAKSFRPKLATLNGSRLPEGSWWATRSPDGPVTLRVLQSGTKAAAEAWGPGGGWALDRIHELIGLDDDPSALVAQHRIVREAQKRQRGMHIGRTGQVFEALFVAVLAQKVTTRAAHASMRGISRALSEAAPGPVAIMLPPAAEAVAAQPYEFFHPFNVERRRALTLIGAARRAKRMSQVIDMERGDAYRLLQAFPGIGEWTAALVMAEAWGDTDAVPVGDYHIPNMVAWALAEEPRGTDERMLELLEPYAGQRGRVIAMLKRSGVGAPKYGPKTAVTNFSNL